MDALTRRGLVNAVVRRAISPMSQTFQIVISKRLSTDDLTTTFKVLVPKGLRIDIRLEIAELPEEPGAVWATLGDSEDQAWPCILNVLVCRDECQLGEYPDLRIAQKLWERYAADSLCGTYSFVEHLDPHDPYWSLACLKGKWYLVSTAGTQLMGPYTGGSSKVAGNAAIRVIREVLIPQ